MEESHKPTSDPAQRVAEPQPPTKPSPKRQRRAKPRIATNRAAALPKSPDQPQGQRHGSGAAGPGAVPGPEPEPARDERPGLAEFQNDPNSAQGFTRHPPEDTTDQCCITPHPTDAERNTTVAKHPTKTLREAIIELSEAFCNVREPKKRQYAAAMALIGTSTKATKAAGISQATPYTRQWREDAELQDALARAEQMYGQVLEAEIDRRAVEGIWKPTGWYKGEPGGYLKEYSDLLLIFRTKGVLGDKYRDRVESHGWLASIDVTRLSDEQLARLRAGESALSVLGTPAQVVKALPAGPAEPDR